MNENVATSSSAPLALAPAAGEEALQIAADLLVFLAPLFPQVSAATKTAMGMEVWVRSWAAMIEQECLSRRQVAHGCSLLGRLNPDVPLTWPRFSMLCHECIDPFGSEAGYRKTLEIVEKYGARICGIRPPSG